MNDANDQDLSRRALLKGGGAALAGLSGLSVLQVAGPAHAFPGQSDEDDDAPGTTNGPVRGMTTRANPATRSSGGRTSPRRSRSRNRTPSS